MFEKPKSRKIYYSLFPFLRQARVHRIRNHWERREKAEVFRSEDWIEQIESIAFSFFPRWQHSFQAIAQGLFRFSVFSHTTRNSILNRISAFTKSRKTKNGNFEWTLGYMSLSFDQLSVLLIDKKSKYECLVDCFLTLNYKIFPRLGYVIRMHLIWK